jgi:hypothetical protein
MRMDRRGGSVLEEIEAAGKRMVTIETIGALEIIAGDDEENIVLVIICVDIMEQQETLKGYEI